MKIIDTEPTQPTKHFRIEELGYKDLNLMYRSWEREKTGLTEYRGFLEEMDSESAKDILDETNEKIDKLDNWMEQAFKAMGWK